MLNETISNNCTYATCSVNEYGQLEYIPSLAGNMLYLSIFTLCLICQLVFGIHYRTWGYMLGMLGGLVLEILGYIARVQLHYDAFSEHKFTNYVIGTTIGPAFFSMSIYLCLARIMYICGIELSSIGPRTITAIFVCCDLVSIVLQALGGSLSVTAKTIQQHNKGIHITIAGLSSQVGSMVIFIGFVAMSPGSGGLSHPKSTRSRNLYARRFSSADLCLVNYPIGIAVATILILIRCCFRVAELHAGYGGKLANNQVLYMVLEGAMITGASLALTFGHPGIALGSVWQASGLTSRNRSGGPDEESKVETSETQD